MTVATRRKRTVKAAEDRRRDILDAAARVFAQSGVPGTTVADITEVAGVAKGTFYLYFDSKEHLLGALRERHADQVVQRATEYGQRAGSEDLWKLADAFLEAIIDLELEQRDIVQVLCQEGLTEPSSIVFAESERKVHAVIASGIRSGIESGILGSSDPDLTASLLMHAVIGTVQHLILYGEDIDRDRLVAAAKELVHKTLAPADN
jgi:AcrR family transcriptional regulator